MHVRVNEWEAHMNYTYRVSHEYYIHNNYRVLTNVHVYLERDYYTHEIDVYACALLLSVGWSITHALHVYACTAVHGGLVYYGRLPAC